MIRTTTLTTAALLGLAPLVPTSAQAAAETARERVQGAYGEAKARVATAKARVDPMVREQPYVALGVAATVGLLAGLLLAGRGPKVIYIKPPRP